MSRIIKSQFTTNETTTIKTIKIRDFEQSLQGFNDTQTIMESHSINQRIEQAQEDAENILNDAQLKAADILQEIQAAKDFWEEKEKVQYIEQAHDIGYSDGVKTGKQKGYEEWEENILSAKQVIELAKRDYRKHIEASESIILDLSIAVASKIIGRNLADSEEVFLSIVKNAIKEARDYREVQLHIHPAHYKLILSQKDELQAIFPLETTLYIYPDAELLEDSCIIVSDNGRIDASVDSQLNVIKQKLADILEGE